MAGLADQAGRFVRSLWCRVSTLWDRHRPEIQARGRAVLPLVEECWRNHVYRATLLYRWMCRQYSPKRPIRSVIWASLRLLWGTGHELLSWLPPPPGEDEWAPFKPEFTPYTPNLDAPFDRLPVVGDPPPPLGELPPPPEV